MQKTQAELNKNRIKRRILEAPSGISRSELADKTGLDIRTVTAYCNELVEKEIIREERISNGNGRPSVYYFQNIDKLMFLGMHIREKIDYLLLDSRHAIKYVGSIDINPENESQSALIIRLLDDIRKMQREFPDKKLAGIGFSISRFLQPPRVERDLCSDLIDAVYRETGVPVFRERPINVVLYRISALHGESEAGIAAINTGIQLELGIMKDRFPISDNAAHEEYARHFQAEADGRPCFCGKKGCLVNYATKGGLVDMYNEISGKKEKVSYPDFAELLENGDEKALQVAEKAGNCLGSYLYDLVSKHKLEMIFILNSRREIIDVARNRYLALNGDPTVRIDRFSFRGACDDMLAAAEMAGYHVLN